MRRKILKELGSVKGEFVSGSKLASILGISRVAVWKHIEALKSDGYDIVGTSGRGYRFDDPYYSWLYDEIPAQLNTTSIGTEIKYCAEVDSTNKKIRELFQANQIKPGGVLLASKQTQGRGRRGRKWETVSGGLTFSLLLQPPLPLREITLLSLVFAVAIASALEEILTMPVHIKWPNDVYVQGKKIAGILLELGGELDSVNYLITGIGININNSMDLMPEGIKSIATSLKQVSEGQDYDMSSVLELVLKSLDEYYNRFLDKGFADILLEFKDRCFHLGKAVRIDLGDKTIAGINTDIDYVGSLLIDTGEKTEKLSTGDVHLL